VYLALCLRLLTLSPSPPRTVHLYTLLQRCSLTVYNLVVSNIPFPSRYRLVRSHNSRNSENPSYSHPHYHPSFPSTCSRVTDSVCSDRFVHIPVSPSHAFGTPLKAPISYSSNNLYPTHRPQLALPLRLQFVSRQFGTARFLGHGNLSQARRLRRGTVVPSHDLRYHRPEGLAARRRCGQWVH
jgi:hypothetical protein